jgi:hypothetical protein
VSDFQSDKSDEDDEDTGGFENFESSSGRDYFRVTTKDYGKTVTFKPRVQWEVTGPKRIPVAPSIEGCLVALGSILGEKGNDTVYVYKLTDVVTVVFPGFGDVNDVEATDETWILKPATFKRIMVIKKSDLPSWNKLIRIEAGMEPVVPEQIRVKKALKKELSSLKKGRI